MKDFKPSLDREGTGLNGYDWQFCEQLQDIVLLLARIAEALEKIEKREC